MKTIASMFAAAVMLVAPAITQANKKYVPLPSKVLSAKTIYVENRTTDGTLQDITTLELAKWGHFQLAETREKADIVLRLEGSNSVRLVSERESTSYGSMKASFASDREPVRAGFTRITLIETKSGAPLWSDERKMNGIQAKRHVLEGLRDAFDEEDRKRLK